MLSAIQATTDLYKYIRGHVTEDVTTMTYLEGLEIFKDEDKPSTYTGSYIAINALPFSFGRKVINSDNILNLNIHVPDNQYAQADRPKIQKLQDYIFSLFGFESTIEDDDSGVLINGAYYAVSSASRPMADVDGTHFVNIKIKLTLT